MYVLPAIVFSVLFCYVLSDTPEEIMVNRYCENDCNREKTRICVQKHIPIYLSTYENCVKTVQDGLTTAKEWDQFVCHDATNQESLLIINCLFGTMREKYGNVDDVAKECLEQSGC
uniref:Venom protein n=1 Tax=Hadrurus spadix TaxID=141984 RepID=A0A1W7R972_9SCOR